MYIRNIEAHEFRSASEKIDRALQARLETPEWERAKFRTLIIALVDEACNGKTLYMPVDSEGGQCFAVTYHAVPVYPMYTDREKAQACAELLAEGEENLRPGVVECPISGVIRQRPAAIYLNMGLPEQVLLKSGDVRTVQHLAIVRSEGTKGPVAPEWTAWHREMNHYFSLQAEERKRLAKQRGLFSFVGKKHKGSEANEMSFAEEAVMELPVVHAIAPLGRHVNSVDSMKQFEVE